MSEIPLANRFGEVAARPALPQSIVEAITDLIIAGELRPGDRLPTEAAFAQQYGVGRNSYREAIKMLSSMGAVKIARGEGTYVTKEIPASAITAPLILQLAYMQAPDHQLVELRLLLEVGLAELALSKVGPEDLDRLTEINDEMLAYSRRLGATDEELFERDMAFHKQLLDIGGNALLEQLYFAVSKLFAASVRFSVNQDPNVAHKNHAAVIDAMRRGDPDEVRAITRDSFEFWTDVVARLKTPQ